MSEMRQKDRDAVIQSLRAGVVPRSGQHLVQVGRARELESLIGDINRLAEGGSAFRLIIGEYGSGKTFFLNLVRAVGMEKKLVTTCADLTPDRRLHSSSGHARSLYAELSRNLSTRAKPDGGALAGIVERFVSSALAEANATTEGPDVVIHRKLGSLSELVGGYDFATVIAGYWKGFDTGNEQLKSDAIRWLRGEFSTKTDARAALGVRTIVGDAEVYDQLKLLARFVRLAGFAGLLICLDELVNLYKLANAQARNTNYEQLLRILNDALQGSAEGLGFVFGGTPEFLLDTRRGLYSYPALQSRLAENAFARQQGFVDFTGPVLKLANLAPEDFYVLLQKLRHVYAMGKEQNYLLPDEALPAFMTHCQQRIGDAFFRTPRTTITAFINLLAVLEQNPTANWRELLGAVKVVKDTGALHELAPDARSVDADDDLASFRL